MVEENIERYYTVGARAISTGDWEAYASLYAEDLLMVTPGSRPRLSHSPKPWL